MNIKDLIKKSKGVKIPVKETLENCELTPVSDKPLAEEFVPAESGAAFPVLKDIVKQAEPTSSGFNLANATKALRETVKKVNNPLLNPEPIVQMPLPKTDPPSDTFKPTIENLDSFIFDEQEQQSNEEIATTFSDLLKELASSMDAKVPYNLANCLKFLEENAFLSELLKPSDFATLVLGLRKSNGHIIKMKNRRLDGKDKKANTENAVLDMLAGIDI